MKKLFIQLMVLSALPGGMIPGMASAQKPAAPQNVRTEVVGHKVTLSWENPDAGATVCETGFEGEKPFEGWTIRTTNDHDPIYTWFSYPESRFLPDEGADAGEADNYREYIYKGEQSAMVYYDVSFQEEHDMRQDEWLISPELDNAAYLVFHYFINPMVLEYGMNEAFPDHYVVVVSKDGGATWSEPLWDARYDASAEYGWATAVLALDETPSDHVRIAFRAYGDMQEDANGDPVNQGLYFLWCLDEVSVTSSLPAVDETALAGKAAPRGETYRAFAMSRPVAARKASRTGNPHAKMPVIRSYDILLDGELLAEGVLSHTYVDRSEKEPGEHTYAVVAKTADGASDPVSVSVDLCDLVFAAPENFVCEVVYDEDMDNYSIVMTWDEPDSEFPPVSYNVYCDGGTFGFEITDMSMEMWDVTPGVYEMAIEAVYETPDGWSEQVSKMVPVNVRFGVSDLTAEVKDKNVELSWKAPADETHEMGSYTIYRAQEKIAENVTETSYRDGNVADGYYRYTVIAVYKDGKESLPVYTDCQKGENVMVDLPYEQKFMTSFWPENIRTENLLPEYTPDKYGWYFDDGSRLGIEGDGFDGYYAAVDYQEAGMYPLDYTLQLPAIRINGVKLSSLSLSFNYSYASTGEDQAGVEWSVDGTEWFLLKAALHENDDPDVPEIRVIDWEICDDDKVKAAFEKAGVFYLRFHYEGTDFDGLSPYHFAIDNIRISGEKTSGKPTDPDIPADSLAVEGARAVQVAVSVAGGQMSVEASAAIERIGIYAFDGRQLAERVGNGALRMTMPVYVHGPALVRVTTAKGIKVMKVIL